ncbi:MAG: MFS transporter, partial [Clostridiales bacterium]|nr:MFS transporter [Clostridiales bacterium]
DNTLLATVAGGWAVGSFVFTRINRHDADRQALLADVIDHIEFKSGIRTDGLTMSIYSSLMVASTPIMNAVFMAMLGSGYDAAATAQTAAVQSTITVSYIWVETIAFAVDALLVLFFTVEKNLPAEQTAIAERKKG